MKSLRIRNNPLRNSQQSFQGFTLIEMLVVIIIILIISIFSYTAVSSVLEGDRVRGGARSIESFLEGARNRAIHSKQIRGVRFILDENIKEGGDSVAVSSMIYIGAPDSFSQGFVRINADNRTLDVVPAAWTQLINRELFFDGARIKIPNDTSGEWYTISDVDPAPLTYSWKLNRPGYAGPTGSDVTYLLELQPGILPSQEPRVFPRGVVIDLDNSQIPDDWTTSGVAPYSNKMDILFAPDGNMIGKTLTSGLVHLVVADQRDVVQNKFAGSGTKEGDEFIVSIIPLTGNVGVYPIDPGDVFRFAEEGEVAK